MSAKVCGLIWEVGPAERLQRFVLLAIGDNSTDDGYAYPGIELLARKTLFSPRHVMRAIQNLEKEGWLRVERKAQKDGKGSEYFIDVERLETLKDEQRASRKSGDIQSRTQVTSVQTQVTSRADSGDICDIPILKNRQEPSENLFPESSSGDPPQPGDSKANLKPRERAERGVRMVLFPHYLSVCDRAESYTLTPARLKKGADRFLECVAKARGNWNAAGETFMRAIDALADSDFHMGRDPKTNGKRYCDWIDNLCKSAEQFEKWVVRAMESE